MNIIVEQHLASLLLLPFLCVESYECPDCPEQHYAIILGWLFWTLEIEF